MSKKYGILPDPLNDRVVLDVKAPPQLPLKTIKIWPNDNFIPDWKELKSHLQLEGKISKKDFLSMIEIFIQILKTESNIIYIDDPVTIIGDIHGQYYDLLKIIDSIQNIENSKFCFLGDYVDRGSFSIECLILLIALKINYTHKFTMLRGNHESRQMTAHFNFHSECIVKYDEEVYNKLMDAFDALPLMAIINNKFLAVHGGISPTCSDLKVIANMDRYKEVPKQGVITDILWSDPIDNYESAISTEWIENSKRGCSYKFGAKALVPYLTNNNLFCIIRAHEAQLEGFKFYKWKKKVDFPSCITIFSAPNYCDVYNNKGAIMKFNNNLFNLVQFNCSPHPFLLPDFQNIFSWSIPFISERSKKILFYIFKFIQFFS
jgi:serine/threonine-protein phosphatase 2B catalytic subunit